MQNLVHGRFDFSNNSAIINYRKDNRTKKKKKRKEKEKKRKKVDLKKGEGRKKAI